MVPPISTGTRLPSFRTYSFSNGWADPTRFNSATVCESRSRHSGGVRSVRCRRPEARSSRSYPTMRRNASLASRMRPSTSQMMMPMMSASNRRLILISRAAEIALELDVLPRSPFFAVSLRAARAPAPLRPARRRGQRRRRSATSSVARMLQRALPGRRAESARDPPSGRFASGSRPCCGSSPARPARTCRPSSAARRFRVALLQRSASDVRPEGPATDRPRPASVAPEPPVVHFRQRRRRP